MRTGIAIAAVLATIGSAVGARAATGSISGRVTADGGAQLEGICVEAWTSGSQAGAAMTQSDGAYVIDGLQDASYEVHFTDCLARTYIPQWYSGATVQTDARPVPVHGDAVSGIDATLVRGTMISGRITDTSAQPLSQICVEPFPSSPGETYGVVQTDANGDYALSGLAPNTYAISIRDCVAHKYVSVWWRDRPSLQTADGVYVASSDVTSIDDSLSLPSSISGKITDAASGVPVTQACVYAYSANAVVWGGTCDIGSDGSYGIGGIPAGSYSVFFEARDGAHASQWWQKASSYYSAYSVGVNSGADTPGIDAALTAGGTISGSAVASEDPDAGVDSVCMTAVDASGNLAGTGCTGTDGSGDYRIFGLAPGSYDVLATPAKDRGLMWYRDKPIQHFADAVHVGAENDTSAVDFALHELGSTDLAVDSVDVAPTHDNPPTDAGWLRQVNAMIENRSDADVANALVQIEGCPQTTGGCEQFDSELMDLPAHARIDISRRWDAYGFVGDVRVRANVYIPFDGDPSNDYKETSYYVTAGAGAGARTPLSHDCQTVVDVRATDNACGDLLGVSGTGNATCRGGLCASGTGDARNETGDGSCGLSGAINDVNAGVGCVALSGTGSAENDAGSVSCGWGFAGDAAVDAASGCLALSGTGNSANHTGSSSCGWGFGGAGGIGVGVGCLAVSGKGDATNSAGDSSCGQGVGVLGGVGVGVGCIAISGIGSATNSTGSASCGEGNGVFGGGASGVGCIAFSGSGSATNQVTDNSCGTGSGALGVSGGVGCVSGSVNGPAGNVGGTGNCASSPFGMAEGGEAGIGCAALSVYGDASNQMGSQSCGSDTAVFAAVQAGVGCAAASVFGSASNSAEDASCGAGNGLLGVGGGFGCIAVSVFGRASNSSGDRSCGTGSAGGLGVGAGCVAASVESSASNGAGQGSCGAGAGGLGVAAGAGCVAASVTWEASNEVQNGCGYGSGSLGAGFGVGCIAFSLTGAASNWAGAPCSLTTNVQGTGAGAGCVSAGPIPADARRALDSAACDPGFIGSKGTGCLPLFG